MFRVNLCGWEVLQLIVILMFADFICFLISLITINWRFWNILFLIFFSFTNINLQIFWCLLLLSLAYQLLLRMSSPQIWDNTSKYFTLALVILNSRWSLILGNHSFNKIWSQLRLLVCLSLIDLKVLIFNIWCMRRRGRRRRTFDFIDIYNL